MKTKTLFPIVWTGLLSLLAVATASQSTRAAEDTSFARITSVRIESTNVVVAAEASTDFTKVTLESSTRLGRRAWLPRAVQLISSSEAIANITFTVPISPEIEILRVRGDRTEDTLPAEFYTGTNKFNVAGNGGGNFLGGGTTAGGDGGAGAGGPAAPNEGGRDNASPRGVVESDIWKLEGDTLFFFNQYRGLQVLDVSDPDSPEITGTYDLPGAGEQMYVINGTNVVLLARDNCAWYGTESSSRIVLLQLRNGEPHLVKELPVPGQISESRLVGSALYVVANSYQRRVIPATDLRPAFEVWDWGSDILSFDLADFSTAEEKSRQWVRGYGNVIMATDKYLFVAQQSYEHQVQPYTSTIHSFDISSPNGTFTKLATFNAGGTVKDKFKMHVMDDNFVVVVQLENWQVNQRSTHVRTFSFANPQAPKLLADLKIVENETLFATRFDGDRLYAVTFLRIDPLWIIDLSNPAAPKKLGELEIPGWSTFLQPLGDRLLAIGLDVTNGFSRTAVQLFDVADPANPTLLSKVLIGDQWSGSEANWDEKAFGVLQEENLVLVPFYASGSEGYFQGVQLIDLEADRLVKRGVVEHNMGARRATIHRDRLLSLSSRELLTVDATDRDHPEVIHTTELSWAADRVHLVGDFLIEVDSNNSGGPALRVVNAADPSVVPSTTVLTNLPYLGSVEQNGQLHVLQGRGTEYIYPKDYNPTNYYPIATNPAVFVLTSFNLHALPNLGSAIQTSTQGTLEYYYGQFTGLRVRDDLLVWANSQNYSFPVWHVVGDWGAPTGGAAMSDASFAPGRMAPWWGGGSGHLIAVDLSGATPAFASQVKLTGTNGWWNFGETFTDGGLVFTSHQASEWDPEADRPPYVHYTWDGKNYVLTTNDPPPGAWVQRYYLDVIDFADPTDPLVRPPANIPGALVGLHRNGELLYTRGYFGDPFSYSGEERLAASSYDGVSAHLIAEHKLQQSWPRPLLSDDGVIYLGSPATSTETNATLQVWTVPNSGKFELIETVTLSSPAQQLEKINDILVVQSTDIKLFDARDPSDLTLVGSGNASMCYGVLLDAADGALGRGVWLPVGWYGVLHVPVQAPPAAL